jgi:hypothetical protein
LDEQIIYKFNENSLGAQHSWKTDSMEKTASIALCCCAVQRSLGVLLWWCWWWWRTQKHWQCTPLLVAMYIDDIVTGMERVFLNAVGEPKFNLCNAFLSICFNLYYLLGILCKSDLFSICKYSEAEWCLI